MREFAQFENTDVCSDNNLKLYNLNCKTLILITSILGILWQIPSFAKNNTVRPSNPEKTSFELRGKNDSQNKTSIP